MVRKGILTPFHKLKGFERRLQQPGPSTRLSAPEEEEQTDSISSATVARIARSISEVSQARPTTKLLDAKDLPKLDAPTHPFSRLRAPLILKSTDNGLEKKKDKRSKQKRPLPDKRWRKAISREEILAEGSGMLRVLSLFIYVTLPCCLMAPLMLKWCTLSFCLTAVSDIDI